MEENKKKIVVPSEVIYLLHLLILSFSVALCASSNLGLSMIASPAFIISEKISWLTFGQAEYIVQGILFILMCIFIRKFRPIFLMAFLSCLIYGVMLDLWRLIPIFSSSHNPEEWAMWLRILIFASSLIITSFSVMLAFKTYIYPCVVDFVVTAIVKRYNWKLSIVKWSYDGFMLLVSVVLSWALFGGWVGVGFGTLAAAIINGPVIGFFSRMYDKFFVSKPLFPKAEEYLNR